MQASPSIGRTGAAVRNTESAETDAGLQGNIFRLSCGRVQSSTVLGAERLQLSTAYPAVAAQVAQLARWLYAAT